jgi:hypothetical protein
VIYGRVLTVMQLEFSVSLLSKREGRGSAPSKDGGFSSRLSLVLFHTNHHKMTRRARARCLGLVVPTAWTHKLFTRLQRARLRTKKMSHNHNEDYRDLN